MPMRPPVALALAASSEATAPLVLIPVLPRLLLPAVVVAGLGQPHLALLLPLRFGVLSQWKPAIWRHLKPRLLPQPQQQLSEPLVPQP